MTLKQSGEVAYSGETHNTHENTNQSSMFTKDGELQ